MFVVGTRDVQRSFCISLLIYGGQEFMQGPLAGGYCEEHSGLVLNWALIFWMPHTA